VGRVLIPDPIVLVVNGRDIKSTRARYSINWISN